MTQCPAQPGCSSQPDRSWENRLLSCPHPPSHSPPHQPAQPPHPALNQELGLLPCLLCLTQPPAHPSDPPLPGGGSGSPGSPHPHATPSAGSLKHRLPPFPHLPQAALLFLSTFPQTLKGGRCSLLPALCHNRPEPKPTLDPVSLSCSPLPHAHHQCLGHGKPPAPWATKVGTAFLLLGRGRIPVPASHF